jgi:hypothetical protein
MLLKQNFYNNAIFTQSIIKKILNILLYNKVLVRSFELTLGESTKNSILKSNMLKLIADNYYTFFYISGEKLPNIYLQLNNFINLKPKDSVTYTKKQREEVKYNYWRKSIKYCSGYSYKVQELIFKNYDSKYANLKYKNVSLFLQKINFIKVLKQKLDYFLLFSKSFTTILVLCPQIGGYKTYNHGLTGVVGYSYLKFLFLKQQKNGFNLKKFLVKVVLLPKLMYFNCLKIVFYLKFKAVVQQNGFVLPARMFLYEFINLKGGNKIKFILRKSIKSLELKNLIFWRKRLLPKYGSDNSKI